MSITTVFETKVKNIKERLRLDSRVFFEKEGTASTKMLTGSITPAQQRIGNPQKRKTISKRD